MLFLVFELDGERYALDAREIVRVLPLQPVRAFAGTPPYIAGVIDHEGAPVPVVDMAMLALGRPARALMSTRLVLVNDKAPAALDKTLGTTAGTTAGTTVGTTAAMAAASAEHGARPRRIALLLECATRTQTLAPAAFADSGIATPEARWLGPVASDAHGFVQWVKVEQLLDERVRALLFPDPPTWREAAAPGESMQSDSIPAGRTP
ncbi:chemotaxis protein CheW [Paraburkholderia silviterrae]|uniref:Chemotaxis protein CheW n=1 Tax=Paraburkholderia silviterrae TaxID=2528715 RepID=A0A4R5M164_9BURK|nr:chemotaxis protein CheW [Paraburkholderia silviterrae]TDG18970.1 chemotaxis protein CheW [Paraburkholderia silviterrae]